MALKPTIYKLKVFLSDTDRNFYETLDLTIAKHPSETRERMMARVLAFCINAQEHLIFSEGLSTPNEPDIWAHGLDGQLLTWIDVGEPASARIKKACRNARQVKVYSFNNKSDTWWKLNHKDLSSLNADFYQIAWLELQALTELLERTMDISITINGFSAYITSDKGECEIHWNTLA